MTMRIWSLIGGVIVATICLAVATQAAAESKIYWIEGTSDALQRANLNGSNIEVVTDGLSESPQTIAIDGAGEKMYWLFSSFNGGEIRRANLDGSEIETVVSDLDIPFGSALHVTSGKMYWVAETGMDIQGFSIRTIQRANLDGTGLETLPTEFTALDGIALDGAGGKIYVTASLFPDGGSVIQRTNLDGSGVETLVTFDFDLDRPLIAAAQDIALDLAGGKIYWTYNFQSLSIIQRANLDGNGVKTIVSFVSTDDGTEDIALDPAGGKIYWIPFQVGNPGVRRANLNGSEVEDLLPDVDTRSIALLLDDLGGGGGKTSDIKWDVTGVDVDTVVCKNKTTDQKMRIDGDVPASGSCGDLGLVWDSGDNVQIKAVGTVESVADAGGNAKGIAPNLVVCKNRSTDPPEKVRVENPPSPWNCSDEGLPLAVGERLQWKAKGLAN
jgi:DNA-binding beta-propeller fold protein YncE